MESTPEPNEERASTGEDTQIGLAEAQSNTVAKVVWLVRFECPLGETITLTDDEENSLAIGADYRELSHGIRVRRWGDFLEFSGKPTADTSIALNYGDQLVRLRLTRSYIVIAENVRLDNSGASDMELNIDDLSQTPQWEIGFGDALFAMTRIRFNGMRAVLRLNGGRFIMRELNPTTRAIQ